MRTGRVGKLSREWHDARRTEVGAEEVGSALGRFDPVKEEADDDGMSEVSK